jgi:short-subunit dehydrogenase
MSNEEFVDENIRFALVTGASSGIGLEITRELARRGHPILMVSNEEEKLVRLAGEIRAEYKIKAIPLFTDLALADSAQKVFDYCCENRIKIEILVNNAGMFFFKDIADTPPPRIETMINLQVLTPALLCRLFTEQMIRENIKGYILNMASIAAWMMMPGITLYNSTKSFLYCFSRAMRRETIEHGVSITTICPGAVATGLYKLSPRYIALGVRLGIIMPPKRLAVLVLNKMFKRKAEYFPGGFINRLFIFIVKSMPEWMIRNLRKKIRGMQFS